MLRKVRGFFVSIEGIEGCGKSTHAALLRDWLEARGKQVLLAREPGGTTISEEIRKILLDPANALMDSRTELLLYLASRSQIVQELLLPALEEGRIVVVDRYVDSTLAYQGWGRGIEAAEIRRLNSFASRDLMPDLTILLDLMPSAGLQRKQKSGRARVYGDRLEQEELAFHEKVREGFLALARGEPSRIRAVDSNRDIGAVQAEIRTLLVERLHI